MDAETLRAAAREWRDAGFSFSSSTGPFLRGSEVAALLESAAAEIERLTRNYITYADEIGPMLIAEAGGEIVRLKAESIRLRTCAKCECVGGEACFGLICDECRGGLEAEIERLRKALESMARQVLEGKP